MMNQVAVFGLLVLATLGAGGCMTVKSQRRWMM